VFSGFFGLLLTSSAGIAVGLWASSLTQNQVVAFVVTAVVLTFLSLLEYLGQFFGNLLGNQVVSDSIQFLSFHHRVMQFAQGLIDIRSVVYILSVAVFFLVLTVRSFESRKWK
jgi:ABC-2 type transport system permease protein